MAGGFEIIFGWSSIFEDVVLVVVIVEEEEEDEEEDDDDDDDDEDEDEDEGFEVLVVPELELEVVDETEVASLELGTKGRSSSMFFSVFSNSN